MDSVAKVPVVMQMEAVECGAASLCMILAYCTRIVIAHRLSTIRNCNRIIAISDGLIVEDGTYQSLMAEEGYFAELVKRQMH